MSREFCRDVPDPWGCSKSLCKKSSCAFFVPYPVLPFLVLLEFLDFFPCEEFLAFLSVFPFFCRDFRGSVGIKNPCFFGGFPCLFPKKQGKEGQGKHLASVSQSNVFGIHFAALSGWSVRSRLSEELQGHTSRTHPLRTPPAGPDLTWTRFSPDFGSKSTNPCFFVRDSGTTTKYSKWHFPAEKSVDFPPWGLLTFAGNPVICAVKRRFSHPGSGENYRRIL